MSSRYSDTLFERLVESSISAAIASGGITFRQIVDQLPGAFPLVVARHLKKRGIVGRTSTPRLTDTPKGIPSDFILPHPLDYDWRFSSAAVDRIEMLVRDAGAPKRPVVCVGCPSVASALQKAFSRDTVWLFDRNAPLHDATATAWDLGGTLPQFGPAVVVTDPPWYPDYFRRFLWAIRESSVRGTEVLMAVPPTLTRPGMALELRRLRIWAQSVGFEVIDRSAAALPYVTPLFELNTLRAYGGSDVALDWRKADLWRLRIDSKPICPPPTLPRSDVSWRERKFGATRVRFRENVVIDDFMTLHPLGRNGLLSSVSSRDPLRGQASVVTSGGRFFSIPESPLHDRSARIVGEGARPCMTLRDVLAVEEREEREYYELIREIIRR